MKTEDKIKEQNIKSNFTRNHTIDLLKGICILFVVVTHFSWMGRERLVAGFPFWIDMAIPIFMLISGYVNCLSYKRKEITSLDEAFSVKNWLKPFIRYTIPFLIIFFLEAIINIFFGIFGGGTILHWYEFFIAFLTGGWGPGSYYYPILIQFLIIFPFIFKVIEKYKGKALLGCFFVNLIWEFLKIPFSISSGCYRLLVFRYIFLIAFGCYTALYGFSDKKVNICSIVGAMIGLVFIIASQYLGYKTVIFTQWTTTCLIAVLFIIPLFNVVVLNIQKLPKLFSPIEFIGKASYNIFFVQMVYYNFFSGIIANLIGIRILAFFVDIVLCVGLGLLFYLIETPITKKITNKIYRKAIKNN